MAIQPLKLVKTMSGSEPEYDALVGASSIIPGDLIVKTNNTALVVSADPTNVSHFSQLAGTSTVPGTTAGTLLLGRIRPTDTFEMNAYASVAANSSVPASALDGKADYGVTFQTVSSVAAWFVDLDETAIPVVRIVANNDSATTQYPRLQVQFLQTVVSFP